MTGTIPSELYTLTKLTHLQMQANLLTGTISTMIGQLTGLRYLALSWTAFNGTVPTEIGPLTDLDILTLGGYSSSSKRLTGRIPEELSALSKLTVINIDYTLLTGPLSTWLDGRMESLYSLHISDNELTGTSHTTMGQMANLEYVTLTNDEQLTGPAVPTEFGQLRSLRSLDVGCNQFSGGLPEELLSCTDLSDVCYGGNNNVTVMFPKNWIRVSSEHQQLHCSLSNRFQTIGS